MKFKIEDLQASENIVDLIKSKRNGDNFLATLGDDIVQGFRIDEDSRKEWRDVIEQIMKLIKVDLAEKSFPWPNAANIKYPLIKEAVISYASRTLPEVIQNDRIVKCVVTGKDPKENKLARADRVEDYMTYQLLQDDTEWEESFDKLLQLLPVLGTVFKKTYYSSLTKKNCSELCVPDKIVVNYHTQSLETARRITHILTMYKNDIRERQILGIYDDSIDIESLCPEPDKDSRDSDYPLTVLEQHFWYDFDGDGLMEPYIGFVHLESKKIFRIVNRIKQILRKDNKILKILPIEYFTDFHFIKSFDGGFYSEGFGSLLLPINAAINTTANQLTDAGTLNNTSGGFIGRGIRMKSADFNFIQGEWKVLETAAGVDIGKNIFPMPTKEPSQVLFSLLTMLIQVGKELAQINDTLQGDAPAQNVANNVMNNLIEQGTKVFTAINKRVFRSLKKEFKKLYELNYEYGDNEHYQLVLDDEQADLKKDFELKSLDIYPVADPTVSSNSQRLLKAQILMNLRTADPRAIDEYILHSIQLDEQQISKILPPKDPNAPPPLEAQKTMSEITLNNTKAKQIQLETTHNMQGDPLKAQELAIKDRDSSVRMYESQARIAKMGADKSHNDQKTIITSAKMQHEQALKQNNQQHQQNLDMQNLQLTAIEEGNKRLKDQQQAELKAADIAAKLNIAKLNSDKGTTNE